MCTRPNLAATSSGYSSPFLTADEAAELLRCRRRHVYELVADGRLPRHGEGRRLLLRRSEVLAIASGGGPVR